MIFLAELAFKSDRLLGRRHDGSCECSANRRWLRTPDGGRANPPVSGDIRDIDNGACSSDRTFALVV